MYQNGAIHSFEAVPSLPARFSLPNDTKAYLLLVNSNLVLLVINK